MKRKPNHKYIFVIGGVMSGVGKGIATSSIGLILQSKGFKVNLLKIDQYLNVDAGTMNPTEHGEVFVLNSGLETDQDMGNYERFLNRELGPSDYMTSGMVYKSVIEKERNLGYKGKCVEAVPHIPEEIIRRIKLSAKEAKSDITVIEIGGTTGEYQNIFFLEAARMMHRASPDDVTFILVSYLPIPGNLGEMKTKPTQTASRLLNAAGIQADFIIARSEKPLDAKRKEKLALFCDVRAEHVISAPDVSSIYDVPVNFEKDGLGNRILKHFGLESKQKDLKEWRGMLDKAKKASGEVKIGIVGKYFDSGDFVLSDAYISVIEAIKFSATALGCRAKIDWLSAKDFEKGKEVSMLSEYDGILIPGGFGESGIEGKLKAIHFARENKIPYFGLCYGMQLMVIEYARNVLGLADANTAEINPKSSALVIDIMPDQKQKLAEGNYGGSMRLGTYPCKLKPDTVALSAYASSGFYKPKSSKLKAKSLTIHERHRHRYEVNPTFIERVEAAGMVFSGVSPDGTLMEIAELPKHTHPFFLGTQFHPEFLARPLSPHPLFTAFIKAAMEQKK